MKTSGNLKSYPDVNSLGTSYPCNDIYILRLTDDFEQRIILKKITRSKLRKMASGNSSELAQNINNENVKATSYYQHRDRIEEIHKTILKQSEDQDFQIVKFTEIELGIKATLAHINDCFLHN